MGNKLIARTVSVRGWAPVECWVRVFRIITGLWLFGSGKEVVWGFGFGAKEVMLRSRCSKGFFEALNRSLFQN